MSENENQRDVHLVWDVDGEQFSEMLREADEPLELKVMSGGISYRLLEGDLEEGLLAQDLIAVQRGEDLHIFVSGTQALILTGFFGEDQEAEIELGDADVGSVLLTSSSEGKDEDATLEDGSIVMHMSGEPETLMALAQSLQDETLGTELADYVENQDSGGLGTTALVAGAAAAAGGAALLLASSEEEKDEYAGDTSTTGRLKSLGRTDVDSKIDTDGDSDWFRIDILGGYTYTVNVFPESGLDVKLGLHYYNGSDRLTQDNTAGGGFEGFAYYLGNYGTQTMYVSVSGVGSGTGNYALSVYTETGKTFSSSDSHSETEAVDSFDPASASVLLASAPDIDTSVASAHSDSGLSVGASAAELPALEDVLDVSSTAPIEVADIAPTAPAAASQVPTSFMPPLDANLMAEPPVETVVI